MCIQNALQQHILDITNDGKDIAEFFYATMQGKPPNAKFHHQMEAAKQLRKLGLPTTPSPSTGEEPAPSEGRGWDGGEDHVLPPTLRNPKTKILYILLRQAPSQTQTSSTTK